MTTTITLDQLIEFYEGPDADALYDEVVTEREHALQAAALAAAAGADDALIAAALLHDIGHLLLRDNRPIEEVLEVDHRHDQAGADALQGLFGQSVSEPVRLHVAAKRYLCGKDPDYFDRLSPSSVRSLGVQGGPMTSDECASFERSPHWRQAVALREWDDEAKMKDAPVPTFDVWVPLLRDLAVSQPTRSR